MKIVQIGSVMLDHGMWWDEYNDSCRVEAEAVPNLDGGMIVFEREVRTSSVNVTLKSKQFEWQKKATVDALKALANNSLGQSFTVTDSDANTFDVRFRHEQRGGAVQFERLVDALKFEWYTGTIYLARV